MWLLGVEVGFVGFLISLVGMIWRGFDRHGAARRGMPLWIAAALLCFALLCFALPRVPRPDQAVAAEAVAAEAVATEAIAAARPGVQNKEP